MAMERDYVVHEAHPRPITAISANALRREIFLGFEDGIIKSIEVDTGRLVQTYNEHRGWVTSFLAWAPTKILFSASNDSVVCAIGPGGNIIDKVFVGTPVYSMALNNRRQEIVFGTTNGLQFHRLYETKDSNGHYIDLKPSSIVHEHVDIVRCVLTSDSRVYSGGYDGTLVIYDCPYTGIESAVKCFKNKRAHDAGISCLLVEKDTIENNTWLVTGSFDKSVKVWTNDGKIIHRFDGFLTSITGVCYVPKIKTLWCVAGTNSAYIYDPKSGENVTDYIETFSSQVGEQYYLQIIKYLSEFGLMVATTSRKQFIVYKYNPYGCLASIKHKKSLDSICYTNKAPILIFTGDADDLLKWEQMQSSQLIYVSERLIKAENVAHESSRIQGQELSKYYNTTNYIELFNDLDSKKRTLNKTILRLLFCEKLDLIIAASEDGNVYIWGFDQDAVKILKNMKPLMKNKPTENGVTFAGDAVSTSSIDSFNRLAEFDENNNIISHNTGKSGHVKGENDSVTNRVAGFTLRRIFDEHTSCVTSLAVVDNPSVYSSVFLLTAGWDRRVCIWDLDNQRLYDVFRNVNAKTLDENEIASDGNILDMCYCVSNNWYAYASSDATCYVRKFSQHGADMTLLYTLNGHSSEVNCIRWNPLTKAWATGGEDSTLRIWSDTGVCTNVINCGGVINFICVDLLQEALIVAAHDTIKVYETNEYRLVQVNVGHADSIRDVIIIPDRKYFVSVGWDKTMKIWRMWRRSSLQPKKVEVSNDVKFETWLWNQMKQSVHNDAYSYEDTYDEHADDQDALADIEQMNIPNNNDDSTLSTNRSY